MLILGGAGRFVTKGKDYKKLSTPIYPSPFIIYPFKAGYTHFTLLEGKARGNEWWRLNEFVDVSFSFDRYPNINWVGARQLGLWFIVHHSLSGDDESSRPGRQGQVITFGRGQAKDPAPLQYEHSLTEGAKLFLIDLRETMQALQQSEVFLHKFKVLAKFTSK